MDVFLANSQFVKDRIERYYQEDAHVVHPFVDLEDFIEVQKNPPKKEDFYLMVTAFAPNKRVDLAIEAFNELGFPLKIIGVGSKEVTEKYKLMAKSNIEFLGSLEREEVINHMARAKAFIFPGVEDFGITPLESLAAGTPVIALATGGALETLNYKTATYFPEATSRSLIHGVIEFNKKNFNLDLVRERAIFFSKKHFMTNLKQLSEDLI